MIRLAAILVVSASVLVAQDVPEVFLSVNGAGRSVVRRGWPMIVTATLLAPDASKLAVSFSSGSWAQAAVLSCKHSDGSSVALPLTLLPVENPHLDLEPGGEAGLTWLVEPQVLAGLRDGAYELLLRIDTSTAVQGSWIGSVGSWPARFTLSDEPRTFDPQEEESKLFLWADFHSSAAQYGRALESVETFLARQPAHVAALSLKADLLLLLDRRDEAVAVLEDALARFNERVPTPRHPPRLLYQKIMALAFEAVP